MANRTTYGISTPKNEVQLITAQLNGAGAGNMTLPEATNNGGGEVASNTRTGAGTFNLVFRKKYPKLLAALDPGGIKATTAGLRARFSALDVAAGTATIVCEVGAVATDPAAGDNIHIALFVRNTGRNA